MASQQPTSPSPSQVTCGVAPATPCACCAPLLPALPPPPPRPRAPFSSVRTGCTVAGSSSGADRHRRRRCRPLPSCLLCVACYRRRRVLLYEQLSCQQQQALPSDTSLLLLLPPPPPAGRTANAASAVPAALCACSGERRVRGYWCFTRHRPRHRSGTGCCRLQGGGQLCGQQGQGWVARHMWQPGRCAGV